MTTDTDLEAPTPKTEAEVVEALANQIMQSASDGYSAGWNAAIEEAAKVAEWAHMVPPDGGSPSEEERLVSKSAATAIRKLKR